MFSWPFQWPFQHDDEDLAPGKQFAESSRLAARGNVNPRGEDRAPDPRGTSTWIEEYMDWLGLL